MVKFNGMTADEIMDWYAAQPKQADTYWDPERMPVALNDADAITRRKEWAPLYESLAKW